MQLWNYRARAEKVVSGNSVLLQLDLGFETYRRVVVAVARVPVPDSEEGWAAARDRLTGLVHKGVGNWPLQVVVSRPGTEYVGEFFYFDTKESALVNINDQLDP